jgi:hypothetical protein
MAGASWEGRLPSNEAAFAMVARAGQQAALPQAPVDPTKPALQLTLASSRKEYPPGAPVDLILTIKNDGKERFLFEPNKLTDLHGLTMTGPDGKDVKPLSNPVEIERPNKLVPLEPGKTLTSKADHLRGINLPRAGTNHYLRHVYYPMETPGVYRLRLRMGDAISNELKVKVLGKEEGAGAREDRQIEGLIADLDSPDGTKRAAATLELLRQGKDMLPYLQRAGARQVAHRENDPPQRLHVVYTLLEELPVEVPMAKGRFRADRFMLYVEKSCTQQQIAEWGRRFGFTPSPLCHSGPPHCGAILTKGKTLPEVLNGLLSSAPGVVTIRFAYWD